MPQHPRQIDTPDAALDSDAGLRAVWALRWMAERALIHGNAAEKAMAARLLDYLDTGAGGGIEAALGLAGPGWTGAVRRYRQDRRDAALRRLWCTCWRNLSASAAADLIATRWRRYKSDVWPRRAAAGIVPADDPEATFARLLAAGHDPLKARRIREILSSSDVGELQGVETANETSDLEL